MLISLSIRNIVLIDKLDLSFDTGLTVLTGETGAGKSILLDSLGLALGSRADRSLVRSGAGSGSVSAALEIALGHPAYEVMQENGLDVEDGEDIILRRHITADGRSKAWINDTPVSRSILAQIGDALVEVHGQHDDRGLLDAKAHMSLLDAFGEHGAILKNIENDYAELRAAIAVTDAINAEIVAARADEEYTRHAYDELKALGPEVDEEDNLAERRTLMMQGERAAKDLAEFESILSADEGVDATVRGIIRRIARLDASLADLLSPMSDALDRAAEELTSAADILFSIQQRLDYNPTELEAVEERLFEYRRLMRKYDCSANDLSMLLESFEEKLANLDGGDARLKQAQEKQAICQRKFEDAVEKLSKERAASARDLEKRVNAELAPLKLEAAIFRCTLKPLVPEQWTAAGGEQAVFEVKTNAGTDFGPMVKVASGGELARLILALKVVLAENATVPVMVFDEVDRGIGGATASAVGQRLERLSGHAQVLVVTHSPQVAARGSTQYQIQKRDEGATTKTSVSPLNASERREEIARMLSGAEINDAARSAADQLLASGN